MIIKFSLSRRVLLSVGIPFAFVSSSMAQLYWRTDGTSGQTWTGANWNSGSATATGGTGWTAGSDAVFSANSSLTFVTATNFRNLTVSEGVTVTVGGTNLNAVASAHTIDVGTGATLNWTGSRFDAGSSAIKNGAGTWNPGNPASAKAISGGFTLNAGTVIAGAQSLGTTSSPLTINGGKIQGSGTFSPTAITIGGNFSINLTSTMTFGPWDFTGTMALGAATRTISVDNNSQPTRIANFNGLISGATGAGLIFTGPGKVALNNAGNTYDGGTTISGGAEVIYTSGAFGSGSVTLDGGVLSWENNSADISSRLFLGPDGGTIYNTGTFAPVAAGVITGTGGLTKSGLGGTVTLSAANTFSGITTVKEGTLIVANNLALQNSALDTSNTGAVTLSAATTPTLGGLTGGTNLASVITTGYSGVTALTLNPGTGSTNTYSGVIADGASGMTLTKTGAGTQILSGINTYTGATTISAGTLRLNGSLAAASSVTVASGGTLGGSGTINGATTIQSGGTLAPGNSPGLLTFTNGLTFDSGSMSLLQIQGTDRGVSYDALDVTGGILTYGGTLTLNFSNPIANGTTLSLFNATNAIAGSFTSIGGTLSYAGPFTYNGGLWTLSSGDQLLTFIESTGNLSISAFAVPEPGTYGVICGVVVLGLAAHRRRERRG